MKKKFSNGNKKKSIRERESKKKMKDEIDENGINTETRRKK